ncbi:SixA phosphatase family protein [Sulfurimonas sp.]
MSNFKKLYIIRHAKSSWSDMSLDDFDRPLNKRGKANAPVMGTRFKNKGVKPDIIISSPAKRAISTAKIIAKKVKYVDEIILNKDIYELGSNKLDNILKKLDNENNIVFLFGHNPDLNMLAKYYVDFDENIVTCGVVEIEFDCIRWQDISPRNAKLISFDYPKKITKG